jgi:hypothetical protein
MACSISQRVVAFTWEAAGCDDRDRGFQTLATVLFDDIKWSECHLHAQVCKLKNFSKEQGSLLGPRKWIERSGNWQRAFCCTALHCTALYCTVLHCTALHCTALHWTALHCTVLHCTVLHCTELYCTALHCTELHCTVLNCTALHFKALHCTALQEMSLGVSS